MSRLCAHADLDGEGAHWLEPGEICALSEAAQSGANSDAANDRLGAESETH